MPELTTDFCESIVNNAVLSRKKNTHTVQNVFLIPGQLAN